MDYLSCVKDVRKNYKKLEQIYLFGKKDNNCRLSKYFPE